MAVTLYFFQSVRMDYSPLLILKNFKNIEKLKVLYNEHLYPHYYMFYFVCIYIYIHIYNEHRCDLYIHATLFSVKVSFLEKRVSVSDSLTPLPGKAGSQP